MSSSRLPGKVLADLEGAPMILRQIERIGRVKGISQLVLATSVDSSDDALADVVSAAGCQVYRGSLHDVLDRFAAVARGTTYEHLARLTGDCPLVDPAVVDAVITLHMAEHGDITTNSVEPTLPDGLDVEVMTTKAILEAADEAALAFEREHVTQFIYRRPERYRVVHYRHPQNLSGMRWTVDEPADLAFVRAVYAALQPTKESFGLADVLELLERQPELASINDRFQRNEGLASSVAKEANQGTIA